MNLSKEQLNSYEENGFLLLGNIFSPKEIEDCCQAYDALFQEKQKSYNLEAEWAGNWKEDKSDKKSASWLFIWKRIKRKIENISIFLIKLKFFW